MARLAKAEQGSLASFLLVPGCAWLTSRCGEDLLEFQRKPDIASYLNLPLKKALCGSSFPCVIAIQSEPLTVKVTSGFSTPPGISSQAPLAILKAHFPASSPVMSH